MEKIIGIIIGILITAWVSISGWLTKGRVERIEADVKEKVDVNLCKVLHINLDRNLEQLLQGQKSIQDAIGELEKKVVELSTQFNLGYHNQTERGHR